LLGAGRARHRVFYRSRANQSRVCLAAPANECQGNLQVLASRAVQSEYSGASRFRSEGAICRLACRGSTQVPLWQAASYLAAFAASC